MTRVAIYIRVSTDEQANQGNSLTEQEHRLKSYCAAMGWNDIKLYIDDGYSAGSLDRPALSDMLKNVKKMKHDIVLTTKLDRLCRNLLDLLTLIDDFEEYGCKYASSTESFDTSTPAGRMVLQILGAFAEFERGRIRERVRDNMRSLAKNTDKALGRPCLGYDVVDGKYKINESEAVIVRKMVEMIMEGSGTRNIAIHLNSMGYRTKANKPFTQNHIGKLLKREMLYGASVYNRQTIHKGKVITRPKEEWIIVEEHHEGIISKETFDKIQAITSARRTSWSRPDDSRFLLSGLIRCAHCEGKMAGRYRKKPNGKEYIHYVCSTYMNNNSCFHHQILRDDLEAEVLSALLSVEEKLKIEIQENKQNDDEINIEIDLVKSQMEKVDIKIQRQIGLFEDGDINVEEFRLARKRIQEDKDELKQQLMILLNKKDSKKEEFIGLIKENEKSLQSTDRIVVKNAIRLLIDVIRVENGKDVEIKVRIPL